ncbi:MAG: hypothetical protein AB2417_01455 [Clostridiaceae bacterium]
MNINDRQNQRQKLLQKLLEKEILRIKRICFKYQRRPLFYNKVKIAEAELKEKLLGTYEREDILNEYIYTHKISISSSLIDEYLDYKYDKWESWAGITKKWYKDRLRHVIRHELIHALCYQEFENQVSRDGIRNINADGSPVFLTCLWFLDGDTTGHEVGNKFKHSKVYKEIKNFKTWNEVSAYCVNLILDYNKAIKNIKEKYDKKGYEKLAMRAISNIFIFSSQEFGLYASKCNKAIFKCKENKKFKSIDSVFEIGTYILPKDLEELFVRKINNYNFATLNQEKYSVRDNYMLDMRTGNKIQLKQS